MASWTSPRLPTNRHGARQPASTREPQSGERYRARDLLLPPALLSLARVPLAACFVLVVRSPLLALAVLAAAAFSDIADGWLARRYGWVTPTGAALDPITDKVFVWTVAIALVVSGKLAPLAVLLLSTREVGELPLVLWGALHRTDRKRLRDRASANFSGKFATCLQFVTTCWASLALPRIELWLLGTALAGVVAAIGYWRRELRIERAQRTGDS
jgi:cardiolipin synthase